MSIGQYICPDPTPEQKELGKLFTYDPYDRCGDGVTDTAACDYLCAACLIHDEIFLRGGTYLNWIQANTNFERDVRILANSVDDLLIKEAVAVEAYMFIEIVWTVSWEFWHKIDVNTDITRTQGEAFMKEAKIWINQCAFKLSMETPYPEVV